MYVQLAEFDTKRNYSYFIRKSLNITKDQSPGSFFCIYVMYVYVQLAEFDTKRNNSYFIRESLNITKDQSPGSELF